MALIGGLPRSCKRGVDVDGSTGFESRVFGTNGQKGAKRKMWSQLGPPFSAIVSAIAGVAPQTLVNTYIISSIYHARGISIDIPPLNVDLAR